MAFLIHMRHVWLLAVLCIYHMYTYPSYTAYRRTAHWFVLRYAYMYSNTSLSCLDYEILITQNLLLQVNSNSITRSSSSNTQITFVLDTDNNNTIQPHIGQFLIVNPVSPMSSQAGLQGHQ